MSLTMADFDALPGRVRDLVNRFGNIAHSLWRGGESLNEIEGALMARDAMFSHGGKEVIKYEVTDPDEFDPEFYRLRFADEFRRRGPYAEFTMDEKPRFNEQDDYWFVTATLKR